jgi:cell wall-active antibiotic response 4TMS protein YvqF
LATTYRPPPAPRQRRRGGVVGPLILIFLGSVFLLENTGYLPPNFWVNLWRLWPLILVLVGIELLLAHRVPWPALALLGAVVLVCGAVVTNWNVGTSGSGPSTTRSVQTNLEGASQAAVTVRFGAGQLNVGPIEEPQPNELATMTYQGPAELAPVPRYQRVNGGVGQLEYQTNGRPGTFPFSGGRSDNTARADLNFAPNVPITSFVVQTGATEAHLDLSTLRVSAIDMSIGAATAWVRLPEAAGSTTAHISGGASTITLEIPQGVAAQIQLRGGLSTLNIDQTRFPQVGDNQYRSPDYATAQNKVDITLETGVSTIQVN